MKAETYHCSRLKDAVVCFVGWPSFVLYRCHVNDLFCFLIDSKKLLEGLLPQYTTMFCFELTFQPAKTEGTRASALARVVKEGIAAKRW